MLPIFLHWIIIEEKITQSDAQKWATCWIRVYKKYVEAAAADALPLYQEEQQGISKHKRESWRHDMTNIYVFFEDVFKPSDPIVQAGQ